jgi:hypothetical protein
VQSLAPARVKELLGFSRIVIHEDVPPAAVIDIASVAGVAPGAASRAPLTAPAVTS